jgi:hypothetical protein
MIIEANGKFYTTTLHADERMAVKGIRAEEVKQVIEGGRLDFTEKGDDIYRLDVTGRISLQMMRELLRPIW